MSDRTLIFDLISKGEILNLTPEMLDHMLINELEAKAITGCFESSIVTTLKNIRMCKVFANELVKHVNISVMEVDVVVSSSLNLGYEVTRILSEKYPKIEYIHHSGYIKPGKKILIIGDYLSIDDVENNIWNMKNTILQYHQPQTTIIEPAFVLLNKTGRKTLVDGSSVYSVF